MQARAAKFGIGQIVKHRMFPFRGVVFDVDPEFANTEEWYNAIPEEIKQSLLKPKLKQTQSERERAVAA